jgi:hypothetical protein
MEGTPGRPRVLAPGKIELIQPGRRRGRQPARRPRPGKIFPQLCLLGRQLSQQFFQSIPALPGIFRPEGRAPGRGRPLHQPVENLPHGITLPGAPHQDGGGQIGGGPLVHAVVRHQPISHSLLVPAKGRDVLLDLEQDDKRAAGELARGDEHFVQPDPGPLPRRGLRWPAGGRRNPLVMEEQRLADAVGEAEWFARRQVIGVVGIRAVAPRGDFLVGLQSPGFGAPEKPPAGVPQQVPLVAGQQQDSMKIAAGSFLAVGRCGHFIAADFGAEPRLQPVVKGSRWIRHPIHLETQHRKAGARQPQVAEQLAVRLLQQVIALRRVGRPRLLPPFTLLTLLFGGGHPGAAVAEELHRPLAALFRGLRPWKPEKHEPLVVPPVALENAALNAPEKFRLGCGRLAVGGGAQGQHRETHGG